MAVHSKTLSQRTNNKKNESQFFPSKKLGQTFQLLMFVSSARFPVPKRGAALFLLFFWADDAASLWGVDSLAKVQPKKKQKRDAGGTCRQLPPVDFFRDPTLLPFNWITTLSRHPLAHPSLNTLELKWWRALIGDEQLERALVSLFPHVVRRTSLQKPFLIFIAVTQHEAVRRRPDAPASVTDTTLLRASACRLEPRY